MIPPTRIATKAIIVFLFVFIVSFYIFLVLRSFIKIPLVLPDSARLYSFMIGFVIFKPRQSAATIWLEVGSFGNKTGRRRPRAKKWPIRLHQGATGAPKGRIRQRILTFDAIIVLRVSPSKCSIRDFGSTFAF